VKRLLYWLLDRLAEWRGARRPGRKVMVRVLHPDNEFILSKGDDIERSG
jgi:hypothetical protein